MSKSKRQREKAVAVRYDSERERAPKVVAKGQGELARKIHEIAKDAGIPIHEDSDLVELLGQVELDREIPVELYGALAEILSWIYKANAQMKKEHP